MSPTTYDQLKKLWVVIPSSEEEVSFLQDGSTPLLFLYPRMDRIKVFTSPPSSPPQMGERLVGINGLSYAEKKWYLFNQKTFQLEFEENTTVGKKVTGMKRHVYNTSVDSELITDGPEWPDGWKAPRLYNRAPKSSEIAIETSDPVEVEGTNENEVEILPQDPFEHYLSKLTKILDHDQVRPNRLDIPGKKWKSIGIGVVLSDPRCPLDLWQRFFDRPDVAQLERNSWCKYSASPRDAFWGACKMAVGKHPKEGWNQRLDWLVSIGARARMDWGSTNCLHLLAGAVNADLGQRKAAMESLCEHYRVGRVDNPRKTAGSPWLARDSNRSTPLLRAVRCGDADMAGWLLEKAPAAAWLNDGDGCLASLVAEYLPARQGMALLERAMELAPGSVTSEDLQWAKRQSALNPDSLAWTQTLKDWVKDADVEGTVKPQRTETVEGYGVSLHMLRNRKTPEKGKPNGEVTASPKLRWPAKR